MTIKQLSAEQAAVVDGLCQLKKTVQVLSGYAGTGKTTVIQHLIGELNGFDVCAYTGKAVNVLQSKGVKAQTIHSLIYEAHFDDYGDVYFELAKSIPSNGIIIDEGSMVTEAIYEDLRSFSVPLIFVGDGGQLEPVGDNFNIMKSPDYTLKQIHRNAGEIAQFAEHVREGGRPSRWISKNEQGEKVQFITRQKWKDLAAKVDQVVCAFNDVRVEVNRYVRQQLGRKSAKPEVGDKIICLRNHRAKGLFNGMQGTVGAVDNEKPKQKPWLYFESAGFEGWVQYEPEAFDQARYDVKRYSDDAIPFDYAYAVTCHKCQGSEFDKVLVLEHRCNKWDHSRWAYTAATRAKENLYWCEM